MFNINFQVEGLEEVKYILAELSKTGNHYRAVELKGLERKDSAANNAEVLDYLGRVDANSVNFFRMSRRS